MKYTLGLILFSCFLGCIRPKAPYASLAPGIWRGVLHLNAEPKLPLKDEIERYEKDGTRPIYEIENDLPFMFEVKYEQETPYIEIINGTERIKVDEVYVGRNRSTADDTVYINFSVYDSHIRAILREGILQGEWVVRNKPNYRIPFSAHFGQKDRFQLLPTPQTNDLSGIWDCTFDLNLETPFKAIAEWSQDGNHLTGTFRTETGDYRYLDGTVSGDKFFLSCFDGSHAFLFFGKQSGDTLLGTFKSGIHYTSVWKAFKNPDATLAAATSLTKSTGTPVNFAFLDQNAKTKTITDYHSKIKVLQIMGTWCPNCYDETRFLKTYLAAHPALDVQVIGLACERYNDTAKSLQAIANYRTKMNLPYDVLLAATTTKTAETSKHLPFIDNVISYPTMVILDKNNRVHTIHTGFDGPATSKYKEFEIEFDRVIQNLLKQ